MLRRLGCIWLLVAVAPAAATEFPYTAYINSVDVYVRSGPGKNYYPTEKMQLGQAVEVYRHDPGGWYAIRPTQHSFSWISAGQVEPGDNGLAVVTSDRAVSHVGSSMSEVRDVIQVRLDKGEKVELLENAGGKPDRGGPWLRIAPPAGEFRWVSSKFLSSQAPEAEAPPRKHRGNLLIRNEDPVQEDDAAEDETATDDAEATDEDQETDTGQHVAEAERRPARRPARARSTAPPRPLSEEGHRRQLDRLDVELSAMAAQDVSLWTFAEIRQKAEALVASAPTALDRGRARLMVAKVGKFEDIKQRHNTIAIVSRPGLGNTRGAAGAESARYDGVGRLKPVVSGKVGAPQYALVDGNGAVVSFISPAPGVNLRPYLDKQVGISGPRGFLTDLKKQSISAQRVSLLDAGEIRR